MKGLIVIGTRPEAIKLIPIIKELDKRSISYDIINTNQQEYILDEVLANDNIACDYTLSICGKYEDLELRIEEMLRQTDTILTANKYSYILVQGDTMSAYVGAKYGYKYSIPVYHVEAGMRTFDINNPYPEEMYRVYIDKIAKLHFCPTKNEYINLLKEGIDDRGIFITGNTFIDYRQNIGKDGIVPKQQVLITLHRRENMTWFADILNNIKEIAMQYKDINFIFPIHPNPAIIELAKSILGKIKNITLKDAMHPDVFYNELMSSLMVITDSGGVQEECIFASKKAIIVREKTERSCEFDFIKLVSPNGNNLIKAFSKLLHQHVHNDGRLYYGDGNSAKRIVEIIKESTNEN